MKSTTLEQGIIREVVVPYEPGTMSIAEEVHERQSMLTDFSRRFGKLTYISKIFPQSTAHHISVLVSHSLTVISRFQIRCHS